MGRIKTKLLKRVGLKLFKNHKETFTINFDKNKEILAKFINTPSKKYRNILAGYLVRLVKKEKKYQN